MGSSLPAATPKAQRFKAKVAENKRRPEVMTAQVRDEIIYRFVHTGQLTREISKGLGINHREAVERVIQRAVTTRGPMPRLVSTAKAA